MRSVNDVAKMLNYLGRLLALRIFSLLADDKSVMFAVTERVQRYKGQSVYVRRTTCNGKPTIKRSS